MPHTIHLAAIKVDLNLRMYSQLNSLQLLEAISAISKSDSAQATSQNRNYQDSMTAPLSHTHNNDAAGQDDGNQSGDVSLTPDVSGNILPAVDKVSH